MKKKNVIILIICVVVVMLIFLFRVSIYNKIIWTKVKNATNVSTIQEFMTDWDYKLSYCTAINEKSEGFFSEESLYVFKKENKIVYVDNKKVMLPCIGNNVYTHTKINDLQENDIKSFKKYLNKKSNEPVIGSVTIDSKSTYGYIADKSQATELYEILERVKSK